MDFFGKMPQGRCYKSCLNIQLESAREMLQNELFKDFLKIFSLFLAGVYDCSSFLKWFKNIIIYL